MIDQVVIEKAVEAGWERLASFGALGVICAWLFIERWLVGGKERANRATLSAAIDQNTKATDHFASKIDDLSRAIWQFILTKGGQTGPGSSGKKEESDRTLKSSPPPIQERRSP